MNLVDAVPVFFVLGAFVLGFGYLVKEFVLAKVLTSAFRT